MGFFQFFHLFREAIAMPRPHISTQHRHRAGHAGALYVHCPIHHHCVPVSYETHKQRSLWVDCTQKEHLPGGTLAGGVLCIRGTWKTAEGCNDSKFQSFQRKSICISMLDCKESFFWDKDCSKAAAGIPISRRIREGTVRTKGLGTREKQRFD